MTAWCWSSSANPDAVPRESPIGLLSRLLVAAYFIETGLVLVLGPWTEWWKRNFFADLAPWLPALMASPIVRGGVTLIGLITMLAGLADAWRALVGDLTTGDTAGDSRYSP